MAQAVSRRPLITKARFRFYTDPCVLCNEHSGTVLCSEHSGTVLCSEHSGTVLCNEHSGTVLCNEHSGTVLGSEHSGTVLGSEHSGTVLGSEHSGTVLCNEHNGTVLCSEHSGTGTGFSRLLRVNVIPQMLHAHVYLHTALTRSTNGRNFRERNALSEIEELWTDKYIHFPSVYKRSGI